MQRFDRRTLLAGSAALGLSGALGRVSAQPATQAGAAAPGLHYPFVLPPLPYSAAANEPTVDAETMMLHHDKHHAAYVTNLNAALEPYPELHDMTLAAMLGNLAAVPEPIRATVRNNGGGHANHTMFWQVMGGDGGEPSDAVGAAVTRSFGSFATLKTKVNAAGAGQFGSGWAMVTIDKAGTLSVMARPNQDSPLIEGNQVLFGNDVWEHAYYLTYRNRRADYLQAWWNVVDWGRVGERYAAAMAGTLTV